MLKHIFDIYLSFINVILTSELELFTKRNLIKKMSSHEFIKNKLKPFFKDKSIKFSKKILILLTNFRVISPLIIALRIRKVAKKAINK